MGWTDVFPVFTEEMVDDFEAQATNEERAELEDWYGTERVLNAQPDCPDIVSVSLFWKNVRESDPELPTPTRELLQNAQELGLAERFNPWDHYIRTLLELVPEIRNKFPGVVVRVYLAKDMKFLAEELAQAGNEVHVMKSSSIQFAPGGLWRFLPLSEEGKRITVTDVDRLNELEGDLLRTRTMHQAGVGAWRVPVPTDLDDDRKVVYLPFMGCQFGVEGGQMDTRQLLDAFTWHARKGNIDPFVVFPACGPLEIRAHRWPSYGFDEYFMTVAAYPRLAQGGMLTFVPTFAKSQLLSLDIEYVTWGNPDSELVYFPVDNCCGVEKKATSENHRDVNGSEVQVAEAEPEPQEEPTVAFLFLTREELNHPGIWDQYLEEASRSHHRIFAHSKERNQLSENSLLSAHQITEYVPTEWGGASLVRASLALISAALKDPDCTHFVLLSESCVPIRPFDELSRSLMLDPRSRIRIEPWTEMRKHDILKAQRLENIPGIRKEIAHFHDQWICLNRPDAELILANDRTADFEKVFAADEAYFATMLAALGRPPLYSAANRPITWTEWRDGQPHPESYPLVNARTAARLSDSGCFFARKFPPDSNIGQWKLHKGIAPLEPV